jgi:hypothetical protein
MPLVRLGPLIILHLTGAALPASAQHPPRFDIGSREDVWHAVGYYHIEHDVIRVYNTRAAMVAQEGIRIIPWLLDIARDEEEDVQKRWAAIATLARTRHPAAVSALLEMASTPPLDDVAVWGLVGFTDGRVCEYWWTALHRADHSMAHLNSPMGLSFCDRSYEDQIRALADTTTDWTIKYVAQRAVRRLALPDSQRLLAKGATTPPREDGKYIPSPLTVRAMWDLVCIRESDARGTRDVCPSSPIPADYFEDIPGWWGR